MFKKSGDENLLLYAGASLNELTDELHERGAENRVLLVADTRHCTVPVASLSNHRPVARLRVSRHWEVQLGKEREEHLKKISGLYLSAFFFLGPST